jgi:hypothetical protein
MMNAIYIGMLSGKVGDSISKKSSDRVGKQRQVGVAVQKTLSGHRQGAAMLTGPSASLLVLSLPAAAAGRTAAVMTHAG